MKLRTSEVIDFKIQLPCKSHLLHPFFSQIRIQWVSKYPSSPKFRTPKKLGISENFAIFYDQPSPKNEEFVGNRKCHYYGNFCSKQDSGNSIEVEYESPVRTLDFQWLNSKNFCWKFAIFVEIEFLTGPLLKIRNSDFFWAITFPKFRRTRV